MISRFMIMMMYLMKLLFKETTRIMIVFVFVLVSLAWLDLVFLASPQCMQCSLLLNVISLKLVCTV